MVKTSKIVQEIYKIASGSREKLLPTRLSQLFLPANTNLLDTKAQIEGNCKSQRILQTQGIVIPAGPGTFHLLPLASKAMNKLIDIVDKEMKKIGGQKIFMPCLTTGDLWKTSERWVNIGAELFKLKDRQDRDICLGPTHEEAVTSLVSSLPNLSYKQLPLKLYQITAKFRDEMRPRFGLLRAREFYMKDMYSFDISEEEAQSTYAEVCEAYDRIFKQLCLHVVKVQGLTGNIGGKYSHEYHVLSEIGEDQLQLCTSCDFRTNVELQETISVCPMCKSHMKKSQGIEVGHAFYLGSVYSEAFNAQYINKKGKPELLQMCCYGLGITRLMSASIEALSSKDKLQWPLKLAPYLVCVILPKAGSKEEKSCLFGEHVAMALADFPGLADNVVIDDRTQLTIGRRILDCASLGFPYLVVVGKQSVEALPKIEIHDVYNDKVHVLTHAETMDFFRENCAS
ncbi:probable proline--tRNA ligase, mitochondrial [Limulus polyphemus]|uniref:proline--tRNA ligase n=1 Tax=Limulus polyphemus TaxID=6850 RepID=A0ABM1S972_LIMPO|nr:probable proline--tRNA ligase, mitochondrial [Limulus polyphemus]XP_022240177.1 probable proline--tRNA ligase, mitochondrial [Limulus polyphemus]